MGQGQFETDAEYAASQGKFELDDLKSAKFGSHIPGSGVQGDFRIWHTAGNARLVNRTGDIQFNYATSDTLAESDETFQDQESMLHLEDNEGVKAYYNGVKKFETLSDGAKVHGKLELDGDLKLLNDKKIKVGYDDDLQIYHDTTGDDFSTIKNTTSTQLFIANNNKDIFIRAGDGKDGVRLHPSGEDYKVELFWDDTERLTTWSDGVFLDGGLWIKNYDADGWSGSSNHQKLYLGYDKDLQLYHEVVSGGDDYSTIKNISATQLFIANNNKDIFIRAGDGKDGVRCWPSSDSYKVGLFYDDTLKLETTSGGAKITGDLEVTDDIDLSDSGVITLGTGDDMHVYHDGSNGYIQLKGTGNLFIAGSHSDDPGDGDTHIYIRAKSGEDSIICYDDGKVELFFDGESQLETMSSGVWFKERVHLNDNDDLSMGNSSDFRIFFDGTDCMFHGTSGYFKFNRNLEPTNHRSYDLGDGSNEWDDVYCVDLDESSDRKWKKDIVTSDLGLSFINKLNPVSYKRTDGTSGRTHYGFVAQEVEQTLTDIGKTTKEFGGVTIDKENYFLRFSQFTAPLTKAVQELSAEVETLKAEIAALKSS